MQKYSDVVLSAAGTPVAGAVITVTTYPAGAAATIYGADGGPSVASVATDLNGRFSFYAANGHYSITVSGTGITPVTSNDVVLFDIANERASVTDYKPNGGDWGPSFTSAFAAASVVEVPFLAGGYEVASGFTIPDGKKLVGMGGAETSAFGSAAVGDRGSIIIKAKQSGFTGTATITMGTRTALEGLTVYGTASAAAVKVGNNSTLRSVRAIRGNYGFDMTNIGGVSMIDVQADACNYGMYASSGGTDIQVTNGVFANSIYDGVLLNSGAGQVAFTNTRFEWNGGAPLKLYDVQGGVVVDSTCCIDRNGDPVRLQGATSNVTILARMSRNGVSTANPGLKVHVSIESSGSNINIDPAQFYASTINDDGTGGLAPEYAFSYSGTATNINLLSQPNAQKTGIYYDAATQTAMARNFTIQQQEATLTTVATGSTTIPQDDTIPQNTEGDQYLTVAITPRRVSNVLVIEAEAVVSHSVAAHIVAALFRDATAGALAVTAQYQATATGMVNVRLSHRVTAGSIAATTFKLRIGGTAAGTTTVNGSAAARFFGGTAKTTLRVTELAA